MEIIIGFLISLAITLTGSGAGTITAPVMMLYLGVEPAVAVGTTLLFSLLVKIPVSVLYGFKRQVNLKVLRLMCLGGVPGVFIGANLLKFFDHIQNIKPLILGSVGVIVVLSALINLAFMLKNKKPASHGADNANNVWFKLIPLFTFLIGVEVGFSSAGAGVLGTLLLLYATTLLPGEVVGTDIVFGLILSGVGGGLYLYTGAADTGLLLKLMSGGVFGIALGLVLADKIPARPLKAALLVWVIFIGTQLIYQALGD